MRDPCLFWKAHILRLLDWPEASDERASLYTQHCSQLALSTTEVARLLNFWADDRRPVGVLIYAALRLPIYTGLCWAEDVMHRWDVQSELSGTPR